MSDKHELSHQLVRRQLDVVKDEARREKEKAGSASKREREKELKTKVKNTAIKPKSKRHPDQVNIEYRRRETRREQSVNDPITDIEMTSPSLSPSRTQIELKEGL